MRRPDSMSLRGQQPSITSLTALPDLGGRLMQPELDRLQRGLHAGGKATMKLLGSQHPFLEFTNTQHNKGPRCSGGTQGEDGQEDEKQWKSERRGGNYGAGTQVMQAQNYAKKKADEVDRKKLFEEALAKFRSSDIEGVRPPLAAHNSCRLPKSRLPCWPAFHPRGAPTSTGLDRARLAVHQTGTAPQCCQTHTPADLQPCQINGVAWLHAQ